VERQAEKIWPGQNMKILPHLYLWVVIPVSWMFFAIMDISQIQVYLGRMFGLVAGINVNVSDWQKALANYGWLFLISFAACTPLVEKIYRKMKRHIVGMLLLGALFWICVWRIIVEGNNTFMYFGF
jgi:alginate O-acetyltransferase complex protein AlgI